MHLDYFSGLAGYHIVKLTCEILRRETEILSQHNMAQNILAIGLFNRILVLSRQLLVHSPRLKVKQLVHITVQLK